MLTRKLPLLAKKTVWKTQKRKKQSCIVLLMLINRENKILWLKNTATFKNRLENTSNYSSKRLNLVKRGKSLSNSCRFQFMQHLWQRNEVQFSEKKTKINPFEIKTVLKFNCKRLRKRTTRENFHLKSETQMEKK